ncbi:chromatin assembly factor 1 subunit B [Calliphora vicina]|uniref:chromatin assembly factor 1 subunit B n=1 Tax=Calliphora vicina TaxID=7373 RepID=UPI00325AB88E
MKCKIPEISWHNRDPVLSVDIQPKSNASSNYYRLASGGTDAHVLIWYMKSISSGEHGDIELDLAADLTRHQRAVNVVKWSPNGELLASGDDESVVFIWKQKSDSEPLNILDSTNEQDKEVWITLKVLRGHMEDIYDLSWAPNSLYLVTGSVDNSAMVWDVQKGKSMSILNDHKGFVQGVAWDPKNQYIATLSTDRYLRIFDIQSKKVLYRVSKGTLPVPEDNNLHGKRMRLFHDDTLQTFFRRLCFTPDGKLLLTPAGVTDYEGCTRPLNTTYAFSRYGFRQPAIVLPCPDQYTVAVKCCPLLFKLRPFNGEKNPPVVPLPYRMIFAVATKSSVYFYDTQQKQPFALISNIHYTRLTDITWSNDGRIVVVSSTDGFCSLITFEEGELGEEYENSEAALEAALAQVTKKTKKQKDNEASAKTRKPSTDDSAAAKEAVSVQKEPQLQKVVEQEKKQIPSNTDETKKKEKPSEDKQAVPIAIKRKPTESDVKEDTKKANPIPIKRKPGPVDKSTTNANDEKTDKKTGTNTNTEEIKEDTIQAKPIAIKRKPGPVDDATTNTNEEKTKHKPETEANALENKKDVNEAKPIAIKRKPGPVNEAMTNNTVDQTKLKSATDINTAEKKEDVNKAKPIAVKRKPGPVDETTTRTNDEKTEQEPLLVTNTEDKNETSTKPAEDATPPKKAAIAKVLAADIIIDKEILSTDEKFESPEKKSRPVTPITVRRHPRTPSSLPQTPTSMTNILKSQSPISSLPKEKSTPRQDKKAKPIAVRRAPRAIISTPSVVNSTSLVEEAMDAWPLNKESNTETTQETLPEPNKEPLKESGITPLTVSETTCERTEDIRLVYEETNEATPLNESLPKPLEVAEINADIVEKKADDISKPQTPSGNKTPRRVALKTISTPKSKKKLLD